MPYLSKEEKRATILAGTNLFIEGIRERAEPAGKSIPLTSSFFAVQTAIRVAFQSGLFNLSNINVLGRIYGINLYAQPSYRPYFAKKIMNIARAREIDFDLKEERIVSKVSRADARTLFLKFLDEEYEYSISESLKGKGFDANAEVLVWHLLDDIHNFPRPVGYENKLIYDVVSSYSKLKVDGEKVWDPDKLQNVPLMVDAWMKRLVETQKFAVLPVEEVGPMYSPPRFSEIDGKVLFSGPGSEICKEVIQKASRSPAWPIRTTKEYNFALKHLTSAGLIEFVGEVQPEVRDFVYVVPRDKFIEVEAKLGILNSELGYKKTGETSLTEQIFRTVGRARLATHILKSVDFQTIDMRLKQLESGHTRSDKAMSFILEPLELKGSIEKDETEGRFVVIPEMANDIAILLDVWDNFEFIDLKVPEEEFAKEKRTAQTQVQARSKAMSLFR